MKPITIEMVNKTIKEIKLDILEEISFKGIDNVYEDDTYTMWETLINKPNSGEKTAQEEECSLRAFTILILEIRKLIREKQGICVNLLIDGQSFYSTVFFPSEMKLTEKTVILRGAAAALEISWEHIDSVGLDNIANGFLLGKAEDDGHSLIWYIDWVDFPLRKD